MANSSIATNGVSHDHGGSMATTAVLCLCALTHTYLLFSVFPYAGYFALFLLDGGGGGGSGGGGGGDLSVDNVGIYVGLLGTAFVFGRLVGFWMWKRARSKFGEKASLQASLLLSATFSLSFGMSMSYRHALLSRLALGASNGMSGCIKRAAINYFRHDPPRDDGADSDDDEGEGEERAMSRMLSVLSFGCAFAPAASGWMCSYYRADGSSSPSLLSIYPYLAPNLFGAAMCVVSAALVAAVIETNPMPRDDNNSNNSVGGNGETRPLLRDVKSPGNNTGNGNGRGMLSQMERFLAIWHARSTRSHIIGYTMFSFCLGCIDEALPLFLIATRKGGGLGLSAPAIGLVLAAAGIVASVLQHSNAFRALTEGAGLYPAVRLGAAMATVPMVLIPVSLLFQYPASRPSPLLFVTMLSGVPSAFAFRYFALMGIAATRTVPPRYVDDALRIMALSGLAARASAPVCAGALYTALSGRPWTIWILIGSASAVAAASTCALREAASAKGRGSIVAAAELVGGRGSTAASSSSELAGRRSTYLNQRQRARVYARLWEVHYDRGSEPTIGARWRRIARKVIAINRLGGGMAGGTLGKGDNRKLLHRKVSWADRQLRPGIDVDEVPFFIIGVNKSDTSFQPSVMTPPLMDALQDHLPAAIRGYNYWLKYSLIRDGASLETLDAKSGFSRKSILAVETMDGHVFGCFMGRPWERTCRYEASGVSFLWRMKGRRSFDGPSLSTDEQSGLEDQARIEEDIEVYNWTGENYLCQLFAKDKIAVGGGSTDAEGDGFGFIMGDQLKRGSSGPCKTYGNPCLVPGTEGGEFTVANVEVWALTPFLFESDAERSDRNVRFREESINKKAPSDESPWSIFL